MSKKAVFRCLPLSSAEDSGRLRKRTNRGPVYLADRTALADNALWQKVTSGT